MTAYRQVVSDIAAGAIRGPVVRPRDPVSVDIEVSFRYLRPDEAAPIGGLVTSDDPQVEVWLLHGTVTAWSVADGAVLARFVDPMTLSQFLTWLPMAQVTSVTAGDLDGRRPQQMLLRIEAADG